MEWERVHVVLLMDKKREGGGARANDVLGKEERSDLES